MLIQARRHHGHFAGLHVLDVFARDPHFFPEHDVAPYRPHALLLWEADAPDHVEDISRFVDVKLDALLAHRSQHTSTMRISSLAVPGFTEVDGSTVMPTPLATIWRIVSSEPPAMARVRVVWQNSSTWSRRQ